MDEGTTAKKSGESTICAEIADREFFFSIAPGNI